MLQTEDRSWLKRESKTVMPGNVWFAIMKKISSCTNAAKRKLEHAKTNMQECQSPEVVTYAKFTVDIPSFINEYSSFCALHRIIFWNTAKC